MFEQPRRFRHLGPRAALAVTVVGAVIGFIWFANSLDLFHPIAILVIAAIPLLILFAYLSDEVGRPALWTSGLTPFEGMLSVGWSLIGYLATPFLVGAFVVAFRERSSRLFLGTSIQWLGAIFVVSMVPSFIPAILSFDTTAILVLGQRVAVILFVGVFAYGFASSGRSMLIAKILVASAAIFVALSALEFYWGFTVNSSISRTLVGAQFGTSNASILDSGQFSDSLRLRGFGGSENRLAAWSLLPIFLAMAWLMTTKSMVGRAVAITALAILIGGLVGTVSRSAYLALAAGFIVIGVSSVTTSKYKIGLMLLIGIAIILFSLRTTVGDIVFLRFEGEGLVHDSRNDLWIASIHEFTRSTIIIGVGYGEFDPTNYSGYEGRKLGSHNATLDLLVESGVVTALVFLALIARSIWVLARPSENEAAEESIWRIAFLAGIVALFVMNIFHSFLFDRFLWIALGFAAAKELRLGVDGDNRHVDPVSEGR